MKYAELENVIRNAKGKYICFFGAGLIGSTWAYDLLKEMECDINFYCDNNKKEGLIIRDGIKTISLNTLYSLKENVMVFITVGSKHQESIRNQLQKNGIHNSVKMDYLFLQIFIKSLYEMGDLNIKRKFKFILDDREYICRRFEYHMGYPLDLENPQTFNEKIQWLKLYDRNPDYIQMVDKYEAKKYVTHKVGEKYIIPTLGVYEAFDEIEFEKFPKQFVLKCTHDSGSIVICTDKKYFNMDNARNILENGLKRNFFWAGREWPYKNVKPRIIAEKYMVNESSHELKDYKFFCFNGSAKAMFVASERSDITVETKFDFYDMEFRHLPFINGHPNAQKEIIRPVGFNIMKMLAEQLSSNVPHMRVDFYEVNGQVYFGEMTFFHYSGFVPFRPYEWDKKFGEWILLPKSTNTLIFS